MLILKKKDIIQHVDLNEDLIPTIEEAFISLSKGKTVMPPIMRIDIEKFHGESDVKAAYIEGLDSFAIKIASGFFDNPKLGLPSSNGLMVLLDSKTGVIKSVLLDEGYLTDTRTAIAGAIASQGIEILNARIFTRKDGIGLDSFWLQSENENIIDDFKLERIKSTIVKSLTGKHNPEIEILKRIKSTSQKEKIMNAPARVFINNELSNTQTVLEINGKDRVGLLYFLTTKLTDLGIQIQSASVSTYGHRVVDVFYVKDIFGMKIINKNIFKKIRNELKNILINYPS